MKVPLQQEILDVLRQKLIPELAEIKADIVQIKAEILQIKADIKVINVITNDPDGPFGAKEASEGSIVSTPPAVFEALHDATGVWFTSQPVTPERIVKALKKKGKWLK